MMHDDDDAKYVDDGAWWSRCMMMMITFMMYICTYMVFQWRNWCTISRLLMMDNVYWNLIII